MENEGPCDERKRKELMELAFRSVGVDCDRQAPGDLRDEEGLLVCHVCGKRKEARCNIPYIGVRVHPIECDCQKAAREKREHEEKVRSEQELADEMFSYSTVDERFRESTFENCQETEFNKKQLLIAQRYVEKFDEMMSRNKGLLFYGEPGTGKTYIASCIANALLKKRVPLIVTSIIRLTGAFGPFSNDASYPQLLMQKMNDAKLLVIDDLGSERETEYKTEQVFEVIDSRYGAKKPMIITTNLQLKQMQDECSIRKRRIYERICEVCFPVMFSGPSWRYQTAANDYDEIKKLLMS